MRLEKAVSRILKVDMTIEDLRPHGDPGAVEWVRNLINDVVTDPEVDMMAAGYGIDPEDIFEKTEFIVEIGDFMGMNAGYRTYPNTGRGRIILEIGGNEAEQDNRGLQDTIMHEVDHAARDVARLLGGKSGGLPGIDWMKDPDEQAALKTEIRNMMNDGYTDEQILAAFFTRSLKLKLIPHLPEGVNLVEGWIKEIRQEEHIIEPIT